MKKGQKILLLVIITASALLCILVGLLLLSGREVPVPEPVSTPVPTAVPTPTPEPYGPPSIELFGGEEIEVEASLTDFAEPGWNARDIRGEDLTDEVAVSGEVIPWKTGEYEITYAVSDKNGVETSVVRRVTVVPRPLPETVIPECNVVYLTFDDGPGPETERLLDTLDYYGVKATFFVTAANSDYTYLIGEIAARGHAVGIHTFSHDYNTIYASEEAFFADYKAMRDIIVSTTGSEPHICRFPGGGANTVSSFNPGIMTQLAADLQDLGFAYFDWNVSAADTAVNSTYYTTLENMCEGISQHSTAVCLQHDIYPRSVDAVGDVIAWALKHGYEFRPLDETCYTAHHGIVN